MMEKKNFLFVSLGIFCLLVSHNTLAILLFRMLFIYGFLRKIFLIHNFFLCFFLDFWLSSFFTLPAVFECLTKFAQTQISNPFFLFCRYQAYWSCIHCFIHCCFYMYSDTKKIVKVQKSVIIFSYSYIYRYIFSSSLSSFFGILFLLHLFNFHFVYCPILWFP